MLAVRTPPCTCSCISPYFFHFRSSSRGSAATHSVRGGAGREKVKPKKKFLRVFSGMARLKNFVKVLNEQVFALMQKTDCLNRKAVSLTFSASFLAKFCEFQNLRSDDLRHIQRISSQKFIYHTDTLFPTSPGFLTYPLQDFLLRYVFCYILRIFSQNLALLHQIFIMTFIDSQADIRN